MDREHVTSRDHSQIARPDISVGLPERQETRPYFLQLALVEILPFLKEA
jgi:hypothetical protein